MIQYKELRPGITGGVSEGEFRPVPANYKEEHRKKAYYMKDFPWSYCPCLTHTKSPDKKNLECKRYTPVERGGILLTECYYSMGTLCTLSAVDEVELVKQTEKKELPLLIGYLKTKPGIEELEKRFRE
jgi:hypothetical protein